MCHRLLSFLKQRCGKNRQSSGHENGRQDGPEDHHLLSPPNVICVPRHEGSFGFDLLQTSEDRRLAALIQIKPRAWTTIRQTAISPQSCARSKE
jgi:hypothetical protein